MRAKRGVVLWFPTQAGVILNEAKSLKSQVKNV